MKALGIFLIALGIVMAVFTGFNIIERETVADIGPVEITTEERTPIYWSPWTGMLLIAVGGGILIFGGRAGKKVAH
jgi:hypothetical protein